MLRKTIGKLRRQPRHVRDGVAFWTASGFVSIVCMIWLFNNPIRFDDTLVEKTQQPQKSFFDEIAEQVAAAKEAVPSINSSSVGEEQNVNTDGNEPLERLVNGIRQNSQSNLAVSSSSATSSSASTSIDASAGVQQNVAPQTSQPQEVRIISVSNTATSTENQ